MPDMSEEAWHDLVLRRLAHLRYHAGPTGWHPVLSSQERRLLLDYAAYSIWRDAQGIGMTAQQAEELLP